MNAEQIGNTYSKLDYDGLNNPKSTKKFIFCVVFIGCITFSIYIIYNQIQFDNESKSDPNYKPKTILYFISISVISLIFSFLIAYVWSLISEAVATVNYTNAYNICKMYNFKENTQEFNQCLLNEQRFQQLRYSKKIEI